MSNFRNHCFTVYPPHINKLLECPKVSSKAKGIYMALDSIPNLNTLTIQELSTKFKEGIGATRTGILELEKHGFLIREKLASGHMRYILCENGKPISGDQT